MGIMVSEVYDALLAAGAPEPKARAAAESIWMEDGPSWVAFPIGNWSTDRIRNVSEQRNGMEKGNGEARSLLPVCCLFSTSNIGSQPPYRFGEEPGK